MSKPMRRFPKKGFWDESYFRLIVEHSADLIATTDIRGNFLYLSPSHKKVLGYEPEELIGRNAFTLIHPKNVKQAMTVFRNRLQGKETKPIEFIAFHKNGSHILLQTTAATIVFGKYREPFFLAIMRDVTQIRELERKKEAFVNVAHHELKTPLTSMNGFIHLLRNEQRDSGSKKEKKYLEGLDTQRRKLNSLVNKLTIYSEIQMGGIRLRKTPTTLKDLVSETVAIFSYLNRDIVIRYPRSSDTISVDERLMRHALFQLIQNALRFSPASSPVTITCKKIDEWYVIEVKDVGEGLSKSESEKITQHLEASETLAFPGSGIGLGLYTAAEIVKLHGGHITVTSALKKGTTFSMFLPQSSKKTQIEAISAVA